MTRDWYEQAPCNTCEEEMRAEQLRAEQMQVDRKGK